MMSRQTTLGSGDISLKEISRETLLPEISSHSRGVAKTVPLSILDNTVVRYALTGAVWYLDKPAVEDGAEALSPAILTRSLRATANSYAAWAGQLHWMPYDPSVTLRHGRVGITYGSTADPGIELIVAASSQTISPLLPSREQRLSDGFWDTASLPSEKLLCPVRLALHNTNEWAGRPSVSVQLTTFACGGLSIAVRITHVLADATALLWFIRDWNAVHRALLFNQPLPHLSPIFDPRLIDKAAAGNLDTSAPDPGLLKISRSLPQHRYDWWASADGCPPPMLPQTRPPPELEGADLGPPGELLPWHEWDLSLPVGHCLIYFTPKEIENMWQDASSQQPPGVRVSRLDALLAFVWKLVVRARGLEHDKELVNMVLTVGFRPRLSPPLPNSFLGSCITNASAALTGEEVASSTTLSPLASAIRAVNASFTPTAIGALLHDLAHEVNPQRTWRAFVGRRHTLVTSWLTNDPYGIDFGTGTAPRLVEALMPNIDGCVHVMEGAPSTSGSEAQWRWYDRPVCVSLHVEKEALRRLLEDPELRKYQG
ncbi:transferase family-domain-containing protein [Dichomitus squalens]|uniref:Transferase family-domain-containing protein n=1 Tax=Dichomitus squalens TaxID=114155 RepID=A0A4Q9PTN7_9APHY|nr:transferase family-domain-containing protein [Dichomitus squalens]